MGVRWLTSRQQEHITSDHKSLSLAQKTKASFHGALKTQEADVAEVAADGDLDFSDFDFDDLAFFYDN